MKTVDEKTVTINRRKFLEITGVSTVGGCPRIAEGQ